MQQVAVRRDLAFCSEQLEVEWLRYERCSQRQRLTWRAYALKTAAGTSNATKVNSSSASKSNTKPKPIGSLLVRAKLMTNGLDGQPGRNCRRDVPSETTGISDNLSPEPPAGQSVGADGQRSEEERGTCDGVDARLDVGYRSDVESSLPSARSKARTYLAFRPRVRCPFPRCLQNVENTVNKTEAKTGDEQDDESFVEVPRVTPGGQRRQL